MADIGSASDRAYDEILAGVDERGLTLYPHQEEAILEILAGNNVVLATPTGSGKSLVAEAAHRVALAEGRVSFYTAPIKALVSEKFFDLCARFGADDVGLLTGDASVNADAPIICCTAEVLANIALREGRRADVGLVVMDEFHFYGEPDRGWAWQVPLIELPQAQFVLLSATLGDVTELAADLTARNGRDTAVVDDAERPVPLTFTWSMTPLGETLEEVVTTHQAPVYVVHFTQKDAVEHATSLLNAKLGIAVSQELKDRLNGFVFGPGFGKTLSKLLRAGVGIHHAGMLPRYRRLVEQLAQAGLLTIICGTDTLGVGINVPIRTVLFTGLAKFDGSRQRILKVREFQQIAGRAGRAGFDTAGYVIVMAPEHVIENERALAKVGDDPKRRRGVRRKQPPAGAVVWSEQTYDKLVGGVPETLVSRMKVDNAMLINVLSREEDAFAVTRRLLTDNHEPRSRQLALARRALRLTRSLINSGTVVRLDDVDEHGRRYRLDDAVPDDFALNQPLSHFALATLDVLDPESPDYTLDIISVIEATLEAPRQVLFAQQNAARGEAIALMKADGVEYEERMALLEEVTWPQPLAELLEATFEIYRTTHPWLHEDALDPKSIVRQMIEHGMSFSDFIGRYQLARSEGLLLRYLTDAFRALRQTVPEAHRTPELEDLQEWLGETIRQTDSSLLDEWEAMNDPEHAAKVATGAAPSLPRPLSQQERPLRVMIRNAMWRRVDLVARDQVEALANLDAGPLDAVGWDAALEAYYAQHDVVLTDADARGPDHLRIHPASADQAEGMARALAVTQTLLDPAGDLDWVVEALVDLDATDEAGELVLHTTAMRCLTDTPARTA